MQLEPQWKKAFAEIIFRHSNEPTQEELAQLHGSPALRFAGPSSPYPNMSFELTNLSGITSLSNLQVLVIIYQKIESIQELRFLSKLKNLFLYNNQITSLSGVDELTHLEQLYVQWNGIESIKPVQKLRNLRELYIHNNRVSSLEGLTEAHADKLEMFFCKPNESLKQKEILHIERELGIRCRSL
jgi:Leucine-rich repeat (LRR) protein